MCVRVCGVRESVHILCRLLPFLQRQAGGSSAGYENGERGTELETRVTGWWTDRMPQWFAPGVATLPTLVTYVGIPGAWSRQREESLSGWLRSIM